MRPRLLVSLLAAALAVGACAPESRDNADDYQGDERAVADAFFEFRDAVANREEEEICEALLTEELVETITERGQAAGRGSTCPQVIQDSIQDIDATEVEIVEDGIEVSGSTATVRFETDLTEGEDPVDELTFADEDGWRLSELPGA